MAINIGTKCETESKNRQLDSPEMPTLLANNAGIGDRAKLSAVGGRIIRPAPAASKILRYSSQHFKQSLKTHI
ncbi:hypothetical protein B5X24_HaOG201434 [Helicoverpa armigera]|nr:hypothetical protein B5X24_HaOG201434 [Helicoverpa armigera]